MFGRSTPFVVLETPGDLLVSVRLSLSHQSLLLCLAHPDRGLLDHLGTRNRHLREDMCSRSTLFSVESSLVHLSLTSPGLWERGPSVHKSRDLDWSPILPHLVLLI